MPCFTPLLQTRDCDFAVALRPGVASQRRRRSCCAACAAASGWSLRRRHPLATPPVAFRLVLPSAKDHSLELKALRAGSRSVSPNVVPGLVGVAAFEDLLEPFAPLGVHLECSRVGRERVGGQRPSDEWCEDLVDAQRREGSRIATARSANRRARQARGCAAPGVGRYRSGRPRQEIPVEPLLAEPREPGGVGCCADAGGCDHCSWAAGVQVRGWLCVEGERWTATAVMY